MKNPLRDFGTDEPGYSITGWPREDVCDCGARAVILVATYDDASYECRGTPTDPHSGYGPDGCGAVFTRERVDA